MLKKIAKMLGVRDNSLKKMGELPSQLLGSLRKRNNQKEKDWLLTTHYPYSCSGSKREKSSLGG